MEASFPKKYKMCGRIFQPVIVHSKSVIHIGLEDLTCINIY